MIYKLYIKVNNLNNNNNWNIVQDFCVLDNAKEVEQYYKRKNYVVDTKIDYMEVKCGK